MIDIGWVDEIAPLFGATGLPFYGGHAVSFSGVQWIYLCFSDENGTAKGLCLRFCVFWLGFPFVRFFIRFGKSRETLMI
jgi:hypothetical protein